MKNLTLLLALLLMVSCAKEQTVTILQLNVWQEGTIIEGGYQGIVDEIVRSGADFVTLSEVRNYNQSNFCARLVSSLQERGLTYYAFKSYDSGLLSRHPIDDSVAVFEIDGDRGSAYKLTTKVRGIPVSVYTTHMDYRNCAYYDVKGYDGNHWREREPERNIDTILQINTRSMRDDAARAIIEDARGDIAKGHIIFIGGDYNEPSHLDWTEQSKEMFDRGGVVVPWTVTTLFAEANFLDSYRVAHPNPVTHPGITYPADCQMPISKLTWAPKSDERERIDFIHYHDDSRLRLIGSSVVGPDGDIVRAQRVKSESSDEIITPISTWPSDHKGVISTFKLKIAQ